MILIEKKIELKSIKLKKLKTENIEPKNAILLITNNN